MKHKTSELTGALLARAVATACGYRVEKEGREWTVWLPPEATPDASPCHSFGEFGWRPDKNGAHAQPIIEREKISVLICHPGWEAFSTMHTSPRLKDAEGVYGPTYLIAAMRAFVAHKLGDEVDL